MEECLSKNSYLFKRIVSNRTPVLLCLDSDARSKSLKIADIQVLRLKISNLKLKKMYKSFDSWIKFFPVYRKYIIYYKNYYWDSWVKASYIPDPTPTVLTPILTPAPTPTPTPNEKIKYNIYLYT